MEKVDVRGLSCPMPVIKTKKVIDQGVDELIVVGSTQVSKENVYKLAKTNGFEVKITIDNKDLWEMELKR